MPAVRYDTPRYDTARYDVRPVGVVLPPRLAPLAAPHYVIYVRDAARQRIAEVDAYTDLQLTLRMNAVGTWQLTVPADTVAAQYLGFSGGIIITRNGRPLLSGPVRSRRRQWGVDLDQLVFGGPDDLTLLADEFAAPDPAAAPGDYSRQATDRRSGAAETVIKGFVAANIGPGATAPRRRAGVVVAVDQGRGAPVAGEGRFQPLLALAQELAPPGGLRFWLTQDVLSTGLPLVFECGEPRDLSRAAVFSAGRGSLGALDYTEAAAEANYVVVGGPYEGVQRIFLERGDAASIATYGRIATFRDQRGASTVADLDQAITETLLNGKQRTELQVTPLDSPVFAFGQDYDLGDTVTVEVDGEPLVDTIRTITITHTPRVGETVTPYIGSPQLADRWVNVLFRRLQEANRRLSNLERR